VSSEIDEQGSPESDFRALRCISSMDVVDEDPNGGDIRRSRAGIETRKPYRSRPPSGPQSGLLQRALKAPRAEVWGRSGRRWTWVAVRGGMLPAGDEWIRRPSGTMSSFCPFTPRDEMISGQSETCRHSVSSGSRRAPGGATGSVSARLVPSMDYLGRCRSKKSKSSHSRFQNAPSRTRSRPHMTYKNNSVRRVPHVCPASELRCGNSPPLVLLRAPLALVTRNRPLPSQYRRCWAFRQDLCAAETPELPMDVSNRRSHRCVDAVGEA